MGLCEERLDGMAKRVFGADAVLAGGIGSPERPGCIEIRADGVLLARGGTFAEVLMDASRRIHHAAAQSFRRGWSEAETRKRAGLVPDASVTFQPVDERVFFGHPMDE